MGTTGMGMAELTYDPATRVVTWAITYGGLSGPVTMAHFHGPAAKAHPGGEIRGRVVPPTC